MSSKEATPELHSLGLDIFKAFKNLIEDAWESEPTTDIPSRHRIAAEEQRFRLWAHSLGLHQEGHASLDYRVRDSSVIREYLADLLAELKDHLENPILHGDRLPFDQDNEGHHHEVHDVATPSSDDSDDTSLSWDPSEESFHEASFRLSSVTERLDALYKVATKIRNPRNRPQRPTRDLYKHVPKSEREEYMHSHAQIEIAIVAYVHRQQLVECLGHEELMQTGVKVEDLVNQYASPTHWLVRRTGMANARRKQQFFYWKRHADLLSHGPANETPVDIVQRENAPANKMTVQPQEKPAPTGSLATSATRLTKGIGLDDLKSTISHQSRVSTVLNPKGQKLKWPPPPSHLIGKEFFTCPYCKILCPKRYLSEDEWRVHQVHDLQPYHCTYEDCQDPNRIYSSRQEWLDHENQHRRVWHCQIHAEEFETQPEYLQHLNDEHPQSNHTPELVAAVVGSSSKPHRDCPFCPTAFLDVGHMQKHITYHLERLALFALPPTEEAEDCQGLSGQSSDSHQVAEHRGRKDSIQLDFTEEKGVLFYDEGDLQDSQFPSTPEKERFLSKERLEGIQNSIPESGLGYDESRLGFWISSAVGAAREAENAETAALFEEHKKKLAKEAELRELARKKAAREAVNLFAREEEERATAEERAATEAKEAEVIALAAKAAAEEEAAVAITKDAEDRAAREAARANARARFEAAMKATEEAKLIAPREKTAEEEAKERAVAEERAAAEAELIALAAKAAAEEEAAVATAKEAEERAAREASRANARARVEAVMKATEEFRLRALEEKAGEEEAEERAAVAKVAAEEEAAVAFSKEAEERGAAEVRTAIEAKEAEVAEMAKKKKDASTTAQECVHTGCGQMFTDPLEKCEYHPGPPVFHEGQKGWKCCKPRVLTFDEFMAIPPCTTGTHSAIREPRQLDQKLQEDEIPQAKTNEDLEVTNAPRAPTNPGQSTPTSSFLRVEKSEDEDPSQEIPDGIPCKRRACGARYKKGISRDGEECVHHPGVPIFDEGIKGYSCCKRRVLEWDQFMQIKGCRTKNRHLFVADAYKDEIDIGEEESLSSVRHEFYQTPTDVIASFFLKRINKETAKVEFLHKQLVLYLQTTDSPPKRYKAEVPLYGTIDVEKSSYKVLGTKLELKLVKDNGSSWPVLRGDEDRSL